MGNFSLTITGGNILVHKQNVTVDLLDENGLIDKDFLNNELGMITALNNQIKSMEGKMTDVETKVKRHDANFETVQFDSLWNRVYQLEIVNNAMLDRFANIDEEVNRLHTEDYRQNLSFAQLALNFTEINAAQNATLDALSKVDTIQNIRLEAISNIDAVQNLMIEQGNVDHELVLSLHADLRARVLSLESENQLLRDRITSLEPGGKAPTTTKPN